MMMRVLALTVAVLPAACVLDDAPATELTMNVSVSAKDVSKTMLAR